MSCQIIITYWKDIPSQVEARKSRRERAKVMLNERFMIAIDKAAMKSKAHESEEYLKYWRKSEPIVVENNDINDAAKTLAKNLELKYSDDILKTLVDNKGLMP